jgi:hypothetical protein
MTLDEAIKICRTWTPASLALFYEWSFKTNGFTVPDHMWPVCLGLCDKRITKLMLIIGPGSSKSQLISVTYPAWLLGHNPHQTIIGISAGEALMQGFQTAVMDLVEHSETWKHVFPAVRPDKNAGWSTTRGMFVTGRVGGIPDASYWCGGLTSRTLPGKHGKTLIMDDVHNDENSQTEEQIEGVVRKYYNTVIGRADPISARFLVAGRRWHENDIYGQLTKSEEWVVMTLPAERAGSTDLYFDIEVPDHLECVFTDLKVHCFDGTVCGVDSKPCAP